MEVIKKIIKKYVLCGETKNVIMNIVVQTINIPVRIVL